MDRKYQYDLELLSEYGQTDRERDYHRAPHR